MEFLLTGIDAIGNPVDSIVATSMAYGAVGFEDLMPGTCTVIELIPAGYRTSTHDMNDPSVTVTIVSGQEYVAVDGLAQLPGLPSIRFETHGLLLIDWHHCLRNKDRRPSPRDRDRACPGVALAR